MGVEVNCRCWPTKRPSRIWKMQGRSMWNCPCIRWTNSTFTSQKKVCFVLDQPKESKRKKVGSRVQPHLSSSSLFLFLLSQPVNPIIFHILASLLFLFYNVFKLNNVWNHFSLSSSVPRHLAQLWHLVPSLCWQSYAPLRIWKSHGGWGLWLLKKIWDPKSTKQPIIAYFKYFNLHWSFGK